MSDPVRLYQELCTPLRHIKRFQQHATVRPISVAEHSFNVAWLAHTYACSYAEQGSPVTGLLVDPASVAVAGLWHDAAEALLGDFPHPVVYAHPELGRTLAAAEAVAEEALARFAGPLPAVGALGEALVKLADCAELVLYVHEEQRAGNRGIDYPGRRITALLETVLKDRFLSLSQTVAHAKWYEEVVARLHAAINSHPVGADRRLQFACGPEDLLR